MYPIALTLTSVCYLTSTTYAILPPAQSETSMISLLSSGNLMKPSESLLSNVKLNVSSLLNASDVDVKCFVPDQEFSPTFLPSYYEAVQQILSRTDAMVPRQFFLGLKPEDQWNWSGGLGEHDKCTITFANLQPLLTDEFPIILVAHIAALVADKCVTEAAGFMGGHASPGPRKGFVAVSNVNSKTQQ